MNAPPPESASDAKDVAPEQPDPAVGPLERRLLDLLWARGAPTTVREACCAIPELAYTTLMTTLDRLYRKGLLRRCLRGRAFAYQPRVSREQWIGERLSRQLGEVLSAEPGRAALLSHFLSSVGRRDAAMLDELDALLQAERLRLRRGDRSER